MFLIFGMNGGRAVFTTGLHDKLQRLHHYALSLLSLLYRPSRLAGAAPTQQDPHSRFVFVLPWTPCDWPRWTRRPRTVAPLRQGHRSSRPPPPFWRPHSPTP